MKIQQNKESDHPAKKALSKNRGKVRVFSDPPSHRRGSQQSSGQQEMTPSGSMGHTEMEAAGMAVTRVNTGYLGFFAHFV